MDYKNFIVIKPGSISHLSWTDEKYIDKILDLNLYEIVEYNDDNFLDLVDKYLDIDNCEIDKLTITNEIIGDEPYYMYEMMFIDLSDHIAENMIENEIGTLFSLESTKIYSNIIILKTHLPSLSDEINLCSITKLDLNNILLNRVYTKIVIWDDSKFIEQRIIGDIKDYAKIFFDDEYFEKKEILFLNHNLTIWYTTSYGEKGICGRLIDKPIDKCLIYTMKSEEYRGNITLNEIQKIIKLSNILEVDTLNTPEEFSLEKYDKLGRKIIYTKFKILDFIYNKYN